MVTEADATSTTELRGLALPAVKGPGGLFESKRGGDVLFGDLLVALFTPLGTRIMRRGFGSTVHQLLFEPIVDDLDFVNFTIRQVSGSDALPHVTITNVETRAVEKGLEVQITFRATNDQQGSQTRTILVPKTFVSGQAVR